MSDNSGAGSDVTVSGVVGRYATALFELAEEAGALDKVAEDAKALTAALGENPAFAAALSDPSISRGDMGRAVAALAEKMGLTDLAKRFLGLVASKRRMAILPKALAAFQALVAAKRGETTVEVQAAAPLTAEQEKALSEALSKKLGKTVHMYSTVDPELIGGLVVKMGSRMIDASIRSQLARTANRHERGRLSWAWR